MPAKTLAQIIPGCTYSSGAWTVPAAALNQILTTPMTTTVDNGAEFVYSLLQCLNILTQNGTLTNSSAAVSIDNVSRTRSVYECVPNTFSNVNLTSILVSFPFTGAATFEAPDSIVQI